MNKEQTDILREIIHRAAAKAQEQIHEYEALSDPVAPENAIGRVSRMDAINNKSIYEEGLRKARKKLGALESALSRIDDDNFDHCIRCGSGIRFERLKLMPESRLCISCARRS